MKAANTHGFVGVTLFFVLSGFILAYTYSVAPGQIKGTAREFWTARFARVFPMYVVGLLLTAPFVLAWSKSPPYKAGLAALTLIQAWFPMSMREWNPPGWSLSAEAFFYLLFPFAIGPISRLRRAHLLAFVASCWAFSLIGPLWYVFTGTVDRNFWMFNPVVRLPEFLLGIAVGVLWLQQRSTVAALPGYAVGVSFVALAAAMCLPINEAYLMNGASAPFMIAIILGLAEGRSATARFFGSRALVVLGSASYSLYILHWPLWIAATYILGRLGVTFDPPLLFWLVTSAVLVPAAYLCFRFIEEPMSKFLRKRVGRLSPLDRALAQPNRAS